MEYSRATIVRKSPIKLMITNKGIAKCEIFGILEILFYFPQIVNINF